jgi:hypothetical protein
MSDGFVEPEGKIKRSRGRPAKNTVIREIFGENGPKGLPSGEVPGPDNSDSPADLAPINAILESYYRNRGSLAGAARALGVSYYQLRKCVRRDAALKEALEAVWEFLKDEAHAQFMGKVLDPTEKNPTWKIFFLKNHDPRYEERKDGKGAKVTINIGDSNFEKPKVKVVASQEAKPDRENLPDILVPMKVVPKETRTPSKKTHIVLREDE